MVFYHWDLWAKFSFSPSQYPSLCLSRVYVFFSFFCWLHVQIKLAEKKSAVLPWLDAYVATEAACVFCRWLKKIRRLLAKAALQNVPHDFSGSLCKHSPEHFRYMWSIGTLKRSQFLSCQYTDRSMPSQIRFRAWRQCKCLIRAAKVVSLPYFQDCLHKTLSLLCILSMTSIRWIFIEREKHYYILNMFPPKWYSFLFVRMKGKSQHTQYNCAFLVHLTRQRDLKCLC